MRFVFVIVLAGTAASAQARGVTPYLPLDRSPEIERAVEQAMIIAGEPILRRPIAAATVFDALPTICERDAMLCERIDNYLDGYMKRLGLSHASLGLSIGNDDETPVALPNRHGMTSASDYEASAEVYWQPSDYLILTAGVSAVDGASAPTGTLASVGNEYFQLDLGYRDHWYSPLDDSAMLISTQAETMPSVTVSNYTPISGLNFRYELFLAEMSESENIAIEDGTTTGSPRLAGLHFSLEPFEGWSIGINRIVQFGGGERGGDTFGDFVDALINPNEIDNTGTTNDFGNQAASFTTQWMSSGTFPYTIYFEYAGEDTSVSTDWRLGNTGFSAGVRFPRIGPRLDVTLEISEWQNGWYRHHIYGDGLTHEDRVIGHWGGDWRVLRESIGAQSLMASVGWRAGSGALYEGTLRALDNEDYGSTDYETGLSLDFRYSRRWNQFWVGAELNLGRDTFGESYSRVGAFVRF